ncbi:MAG: hypothetical protein ABEI77_06825 [Halorientalis sp.]
MEFDRWSVEMTARRRLFVIAVLGFCILSAGCSSLTGEQTVHSTTPSQTTTARSRPSTSSPTATGTPNSTVTAAPNETTPEKHATANTTNHNQSRSLPKYAAMMRRLLESDDRNMTTLDTPLPENRTYNSGMIDIKSISLEQYSPKTNDTRLRVEYYNTNNEGDGLNEIRVISLVYTHVMNKSLQNDDRISFDEVDTYSYANKSVNHPSTRMKIDGSWAFYYATNAWNGTTYFRTTTATASKYMNETFGDHSDKFKQQLKSESPQNISILRVEEYGAVIFVDYATSTPPRMTQVRAKEISRMIQLYGRSCNDHIFSSKNDIFNGNLSTGASNLFLEERYINHSGDYDVRTWHMYHADESMQIAAGQLSKKQIYEIIKNEVVYERGNLGK